MAMNVYETEQAQVHCLRCDVAYNTAGLSSGLQFGSIPANSFVIAVAVDVTTAFNAVSTNVLTIGTDASSANQIWDASALAETAGSQLVVPIAAFTAARTARTDLFIKYAQTGTAATAGAATVVVLYAASVPAFTPPAV